MTTDDKLEPNVDEFLSQLPNGVGLLQQQKELAEAYIDLYIAHNTGLRTGRTFVMTAVDKYMKDKYHVLRPPQ